MARVGRDGPRVGVGDRSDPRGPEPHSTRGAVAGDESAGGEQVRGVRLVGGGCHSPYHERQVRFHRSISMATFPATPAVGSMNRKTHDINNE